MQVHPTLRFVGTCPGANSTGRALLIHLAKHSLNGISVIVQQKGILATKCKKQNTAQRLKAKNVLFPSMNRESDIGNIGYV